VAVCPPNAARVADRNVCAPTSSTETIVLPGGIVFVRSLATISEPSPAESANRSGKRRGAALSGSGKPRPYMSVVERPEDRRDRKPSLPGREWFRDARARGVVARLDLGTHRRAKRIGADVDQRRPERVEIAAHDVGRKLRLGRCWNLRKIWGDGASRRRDDKLRAGQH
jgi:hypothetical protein